MTNLEARADLASSVRGRKFYTVLADPPWRFANRTGKMAAEWAAPSPASGVLLRLAPTGSPTMPSLEMVEDDILPLDVVRVLFEAVIVEDYPDAHRGLTILVLCTDSGGRPLHAVSGIHRAQPDIAALITAYRPKADRWTADFLHRRR